MQDSWLSRKVDEIKGFADRNEVKNFYDGLKEVHGTTTLGSSPLLSADGSTLITDKEKILERWDEHFNGVLNRPSTINDEATGRLPQIPIDETLEAVPSLEETLKGIRQLSSGKAPGSDPIPAKVYKEGGTALPEKRYQLFQLSWKHESVTGLQGCHSGTPIQKRRKITRPATTIVEFPCCPSHARKILARALLSRLNAHLEQGHLPKSQCGFRRERTWCLLLDSFKSQGQNVDLYSTYVDLTKTFDTVSRENL